MESESTKIDIDPSIHFAIRTKGAQLAGSYGYRTCEREDLQQELWIDCFVRLRRFDETCSTRRTFIHRVVNNRIATLVEAQRASCRDYRLCQHSLDEPATQDGVGRLGETISTEECESRMGRKSLSWLEYSELRIDIDRAIALLPAELAAIAHMLKSAGVGETARQLAIPRATFYRRIAAIRTVFVAAGLDQYLGHSTHGGRQMARAVHRPWASRQEQNTMRQRTVRRSRLGPTRPLRTTDEEHG